MHKSSVRMGVVSRLAFLLLLSFPPKKTEAWICRKHLCFGKTLPDGSCSATTFMRLILAKEADPEDPPKAANNPSHRQRPIQRPIRRPSSVVAQGLQERAKKAQERHDEALKDPTLLTNTQFVDVADLSPTVLRAVTEVLGLQSMTEIQAKTWPVAIAGKSILGRARTGTGKTIAFLLPATQRLLEADMTDYRQGRNVGFLVIAPTRELAMQIAEQATALVTYQHSWTVQVVYGGCSVQRDRAILNQRIPTILVATPGRLLDLLSEKTRVKGNRLFSDCLGETKMVVLDEADRLLHAFPSEMNKILAYLPRAEKRQTLLFSATISTKLKGLLLREGNNILSRDYVSLDCVSGGDVSTQTNVRVDQSYVQLRDMKFYLTGLLSIIDEAMKDNHLKVIIFFPTAKLVKFMAEALSTMNLPVLSIHSRMGQGARNRASSLFRQAKRSILLTSDVSARGLDYPDVSLVVQYGAPYNDELYLHRLGRTGRAGKQGSGLLVLLPFETSLKSKLRRRNVVEGSGVAAFVNEISPAIEKKVNSVKQLVRSGHTVLTPCAETACKSFVAHYLEYAGDWVSGPALLDTASTLAEAFGLVGFSPFPDDLHARLQNNKL